MCITIEIPAGVREELARQAASEGVALEEYAAQLLEDAAVRSATSTAEEKPRPSAEVIEAVETLRNFGRSRGLSLGGMTIRELREEARP